MARVPTLDAPTVAPSAAPTPFQSQQASPAAFGAGVGQAEQGLGGALGQAGDAAYTYAMARTGLNNESAAKDADVAGNAKLTDIMFNTTTGYNMKMGRDAVDAMPDAMAAIQKVRTDTLASLPSDAARNMFDQTFQRRVQMMQEAIGSHADQQSKQWALGSSDARIDSVLGDASRFYNDPAKFGLAVGTAKAEVLSQGQILGWSPDQVNQKQQQVVSKAWSMRLEQQSINDPVGALNTYRQNIDQIDGQTQPMLEKVLKAGALPVQTRSIAQSVMSGGGTVANFDALTAAQTHQESGGAGNQVNADGSPLLSPKGAAGMMQLMPDTARDVAAKLGLAYDPALLTADTPEGKAYNTALGQEYTRQMLQRYGGNQTLALAAYNAGPGRVDQWLVKYGDPRTGAISDSDFINAIPLPETRDYVTKINAAAPPSAAAPPTSADVRTHLPEWMAKARAVGEQIFPNQPDAVDQIVSHVMTYGAQVQAGNAATEKQARDQLLTTSLGLVTTPDGGYAQNPKAQRPASLEELVADPKSKAAWATADPIQQSGILTVLAQNAKGTSPPMSDEALSKYYSLLGQAANDPDGFQQVNLADKGLLDLLPHEMTTHLMTVQATQATKQQRDMQKGENLNHAMSISTGMLSGAGIVRSNGAGGKETPAQIRAAQLYDQFTGRLSTALDTFITTNKRQPTDSEIRTMSGSLLTQGLQSGTGWIYDNQVRSFQVDPSQFYVQVPKEQRAMVQSTLQSQLGHAPSEREMTDYWTRYQLHRASGSAASAGTQ
jgi:hypothetical protein